MHGWIGGAGASPSFNRPKERTLWTSHQYIVGMIYTDKQKLTLTFAPVGNLHRFAAKVTDADIFTSGPQGKNRVKRVLSLLLVGLR